jgi:hypothetical protein
MPVQGTQKIFGAQAVAAPEIDSASWISAVSLLAGALLVLRGRRQQAAAWRAAGSRYALDNTLSIVSAGERGGLSRGARP